MEPLETIPDTVLQDQPAAESTERRSTSSPPQWLSAVLEDPERLQRNACSNIRGFWQQP